MRLTVGSVALLLTACVLALLLRNSFVSAHRQLGWAVACVVVAALLAPVVDLMDRRIPRWLALVITMIGAGAATFFVWFGLVVNLDDGFDTLSKEAPRAAASLEGRYEVAREFRLVERVQSLIENLRGTNDAAVGKAASAAGTYFVCGILTLFFLVYGPRMLRALFAQFGDEHRRERAERRAVAALRNGRRYIALAAAQTVVVAATVGLVSWAFDLPAPVVLGALAGTVGLVPTLGIVVGGLPALLLAAGLNDWRDVAVIGAVLLVLQIVEAFVVRPRVDRATVHVGPALPALVGLLGYELYGIGGALYGAAALVFVIAWLDAIGADDLAVPALGVVDT